MPWTHIDSATLAGNALDLYESEGVYMVRVDGLELMNGHWHESEDELGRMAVQFARVAAPRILLGGLGLGYTLGEACRALGGEGHVTVAELSPAIIGWFGRYLRPTLLPSLPRTVTILQADICDVVRAGGPFDVIALDVDNGPEPLSAAGNAFLYGVEGLRALAECLAPQGVALVWSAFESLAFVTLAEAADFQVLCKAVSFAQQPKVRHYVYVLSRAAFSAEEIALIESA